MRGEGSGRRIGWKIFTAVSIVLLVDAPLPESGDGWAWADWLGFVISLPALAGLITYAFRLPAIEPKFWRYFSYLYAAWILLSIPVMVVRSEPPAGALGFAGVMIAILIVLLFGFFNWLALHRLGSGYAQDR